MVSASHRPHSGDLNSIKADMFALGSCMYEILTGQAPYVGCEETEIEALFSESKFPNTTSLGPIGNIICNCWHGKYTSANQVCADIAGLIHLSFASFLARDNIDRFQQQSRNCTTLLTILPTLQRQSFS